MRNQPKKLSEIIKSRKEDDDNSDCHDVPMDRIFETKPILDLNKEVLKKETEKKVSENKLPSSIEDEVEEKLIQSS